MRAIKFRSWNLESKEMIYSEDVSWSYFTDCLMYNFDYNDKSQMEDFEKQYKVMEYIGIKDRDGKDIYEGDIVAIYYSKNGVETENIYKSDVVKYGTYNIGANGYEYDFIIHGHYVDDEYLYMEMLNSNVKIIGNIYENKERS